MFAGSTSAHSNCQHMQQKLPDLTHSHHLLSLFRCRKFENKCRSTILVHRTNIPMSMRILYALQTQPKKNAFSCTSRFCLSFHLAAAVQHTDTRREVFLQIKSNVIGHRTFIKKNILERTDKEITSEKCLAADNQY